MPVRFDDIGHLLKAFRMGSGMSADQVAQKIGISRAALYRYENGEVAKIDTLDRLAARKVAGCATVQRELDALVAALEGGDNGNAARAT